MGRKKLWLTFRRHTGSRREFLTSPRSLIDHTQDEKNEKQEKGPATLHAIAEWHKEGGSRREGNPMHFSQTNSRRASVTFQTCHVTKDHNPPCRSVERQNGSGAPER